MQTTKKSLTIATTVDCVISAFVLVVLIGVTSQPNSGAIPAGLFILPLFLFAIPWTLAWLFRAVLSSNLTLKERLTYELLLILALVPYVWWLKLPG